MEETHVPWISANTLDQLGGDESLFQEVMEIFLREAPHHLAALGLALRQGNAKTVESMAHTMKGELSYLGVPDISRMARELEEMGHSRNIDSAALLFPRFEANVASLLRSVRDFSAKLPPGGDNVPG